MQNRQALPVVVEFEEWVRAVLAPVLDENASPSRGQEAVDDVGEERDDAGLRHVPAAYLLRRLDEGARCGVVLQERAQCGLTGRRQSREDHQQSVMGPPV